MPDRACGVGPIIDELIAELADEAEAGYDVSSLRERRSRPASA